MQSIVEIGKHSYENERQLDKRVFSGHYLLELPVMRAEEILLKGKDWQPYEQGKQALMENGLGADAVEMVSVKCVDNNGDMIQIDMPPEALYIVNERSKHDTLARAFAINKLERKEMTAEKSLRPVDDRSAKMFPHLAGGRK